MEQVGQRKIDGLWLMIVGIAVLFFLILPTLIVIPMSFSDSQYLEFPPETWSTRWYQHYFGSDEWMLATRTSLKAAFLTMLVATPIGVLAAYGLHASKVPFIRAAFVLLITPMMVPVVLIAIGAFYAYVKLKILYTLIGLVLAHSLLAIPLVVASELPAAWPSTETRFSGVVSAGPKPTPMKAKTKSATRRSPTRIPMGADCANILVSCRRWRLISMMTKRNNVITAPA